jgi:hypothetical protein
MPWTGRIRDVGVEVNRAAGLFDYRGAGNPKRTDVSASERRPRDWLAERFQTAIHGDNFSCGQKSRAR